MKTYNTGFDETIIKFTDRNGRPLEIEDKFNLTLVINNQKCDDILQNQEQENVLNDMDFYRLQQNIKTINRHWTRSSQKVIHEAGGFIGSNIADAVAVIVFRNKNLLIPPENYFTTKKR